MQLQSFAIDAIKRIRNAVGLQPTLSPMQQAPLTSKGAGYAMDSAKSFAKFTPAGDFSRRVMYAKEKQSPPLPTMEDALKAYGLMGAFIRPDIALTSFGVGAAGKMIQNKLDGVNGSEGVIDEGINSARYAGLIQPFTKVNLEPVTSEANKWIRMSIANLLKNRTLEKMGIMPK